MELIREKNHRLERECYKGFVRVSYTLCLENREQFFIPGNEKAINEIVDVLRNECDRESIMNWIYAFMPDHLHLVLEGMNRTSDQIKMIRMFKQRTGFFLKVLTDNRVKWQKGFFDRIHRKQDDLKQQIAYVAKNPERKNIVKRWEEHKYTGSVHIDINGVLNNL